MFSDYYKILGVAPNATDAQIKSAYKSLAKIHHPDKNIGNPNSEEIFKNIGMAYQTLSDPWKRMSYDFKREHLDNPNHPIAPPPLNPNRNKRWKAAAQPSNIKIALVVISIFTIISVGGYYFYGFMNRLAAQDAYVSGMAFEQSKDITSAFLAYSEAITFDPQYANAYYRRGLLQSRFLGNHKMALYDLNQAIAAAIPLATYYFDAAKIALLLPDVSKASQYLDSCTHRFPNYDSAWFYKAEIAYHEQGHYKTAKTAYKNVIDLKPKAAEAYAGIGLCEFQLLNYKSSISNFNTALQLKPSEPQWLYYRGMSKYLLKLTAAACKDWQRASIVGSQQADNCLGKYCQ